MHTRVEVPQRAEGGTRTSGSEGQVVMVQPNWFFHFAAAAVLPIVKILIIMLCCGDL